MRPFLAIFMLTLIACADGSDAPLRRRLIELISPRETRYLQLTDSTLCVYDLGDTARARAMAEELRELLPHTPTV